MKLSRILLITFLLVGGFWFVTTHLPRGMFRGGPSLIRAGGRISGLELKEAHASPAYDA